MFSKMQALLGLGLALFVLGCAPTVGEKPPEQKEIPLKVTKCLNKSAEDLRNFFSAKVSDSDLTAAWSCVDEAFYQFEKYVRGQQKDRYQSQEIVTFLEENFFEDSNVNKVTPELQKELMKLKQLLLGGNADYVTRDELRRSRATIQQLSRMTVKLNPHMKIVVMNWKPHLDSHRSQDLENFEKANEGLQEFAVELSQILLRNPSLYKIDDFMVLIREFEKFFNMTWDWVGDVQDLLPGIKKLKLALAEGGEDSISEKEWEPVLTLGARGYFQFLRYHYFIKTTYETGGGIRLIYVARMLDDVFSIFQNLISKKQSGAVTNAEVYEVLHAFELFWTDLKISEKLIYEFMKIKRVLIGGGLENWTADDFQQARNKIPELRRIIENFMPYYSIYTAEWDPKAEDPQSARKFFDEARSQLAKSGQDLGRFLQGGSYSYDDLLELIKEFDTLYPSSNSQVPVEGEGSKLNLYETFYQFREPFLNFKKMLFAQDDVNVYPDQWAPLLSVIAKGYSAYQFYDYFLAEKELDQPESLEDLGELIDQGLSVLRSLLEATKSRQWSQDDLVKLTVSLTKTNLFEKPMKEETARKLWTAVLSNFLFDPVKRNKGETNSNFSFEQIDIIHTEFRIWFKTQQILNQAFDSRVSYEPQQMLKILKDQALSHQGDAEAYTGLSYLFSQLDSPISATWDKQGQLQISNRVSWVYDSQSLFHNNITRTVARVLMRAFATDANLSRVNECETQSAFDMLVGVFQDLEIFDPSSGFVSSRFLEANIFTTKANGNKFLDYPELTDLLNVIFSGLRTSNKLEESLRKQCAVYKDDKRNNREFVTFKCLRDHHYVAVRQYMDYIPDYKAYIDKMATEGSSGQNKWSSMFRDAMKATGWNPNKGYGSVKEESVSFSEALYYPFILQYTELMYARFDETKNTFLQLVEVEKAFPVFRPLLKDLAKEQLSSGLIKESDLLALFTYILRYKEEPKLSSVLKWLSWKTNENRWVKEIYISRKDIAEILGFIADKVRETNSGGSKPPVCPSSRSVDEEI